MNNCNTCKAQREANLEGVEVENGEADLYDLGSAESNIDARDEKFVNEHFEFYIVA
jgi:hypothetical protein